MKTYTPKPFRTLHLIGASVLCAGLGIAGAIAYYVTQNYAPTSLTARSSRPEVQVVYDTVRVEVVQKVYEPVKTVKPKAVETVPVERVDTTGMQPETIWCLTV